MTPAAVRHRGRLGFGLVGVACVALGIIGACVLAYSTVGGTVYLAFAALVAIPAVVSAVVALPRTAIATAVVIAVFVQTAQQIVHASVISYADDASVLGVSAIVLARTLVVGKIRAMPGGKWFIGFAVAGLLSSQVQHVPLSVTAAGAYLALKGIVIGFAATQLDWDERARKNLIRAGAAIAVIAIVCGAINLVDPVPWTAAIGAPSTVEYRGPLPSLIGPWKHPSYFGQMMALLALAAVAYREAFRKRGILWAIVAAVGAFLSYRRKTWAALPIALLGVLFQRKSPARKTFAILLIPIFLALSWGPVSSAIALTGKQLQDNVNNPRIVLTVGAEQIMRGDFPLGAGFGRYASHEALVNYSPEYSKRGFSAVYGLGPTGLGQTDPNSTYASDTFWPAIGGETGVLGMLCYLLGFIAIWRTFRRCVKNASPAVKFVGLLGVGWFVELLIESVAAPIFTAPPTYPLLFVLAGIAASVLRNASSEAAPAPMTTVTSTGAAAHAHEDLADRRRGDRTRKARRPATAGVGPR